MRFYQVVAEFENGVYLSPLFVEKNKAKQFMELIENKFHHGCIDEKLYSIDNLDHYKGLLKVSLQIVELDCSTMIINS